MDLEKRSEVTGSVLTLHLIGELTGPETPKFKEWVTELCQEHDVNVIELNCSRLHFIDSNGLGSLIFVRKQAIDTEAELRLTEVSGWLRKFLQVTGLEETFCGTPDLDLETEDQS